jgi:cation diffusion facilitator family transporter
VRRVLLVEGAANLSVLVVKVWVGLATGSMAVLGDAVHSLADLANNGLAFFVVGAAGAPPDREHPYGHRKFETLAVFALATLLAVLAVELALRALQRGEREVVRHGWSLALMLGVLVVNAAVASWESRQAQRLDSDLLRADARHTLSDVLVTSAVIAGWGFASLGAPWLDTLAALGVAGLILFLAWDLFRRAIPVLTDHVAADPDEVAGLVRSVPGVREARRVRSMGPDGSVTMDVVVSVDPELSTADSHAIADAVERLLRERLGARDVTVHVEPDRQVRVEPRR